jgi:hypothetical protein
MNGKSKTRPYRRVLHDIYFIIFIIIIIRLLITL